MGIIKRTGMAILLFTLVLSSSVKAEDKPSPGLLSVTGNAEVKVIPDEVILTLGVETFDKDLNIARSQNDERVKKVLALTEQFKIEPKHTQTSYINIEPVYKYDSEPIELKGYFVRKTIVFTIKDVSKFEDVLNAALVTGANYIHGVQFRTTELRKYRDQARSLAIKAAQEKAVALAKELGQNVGKPTSISEGSLDWWSWDNAWWGSWQRGGGMYQNVSQNGARFSGLSSSGESSIALGQISVTAMVSVTFELE